MALGCKGFCTLRYDTHKISSKFTKYVEEGYAACRKCSIMILCNEKYCPCCGCQLASIPNRGRLQMQHLKQEQKKKQRGYEIVEVREKVAILEVKQVK